MIGLWIDATALVGGFAVLVFGADRFVLGAASIARHLGISALVVGLAIVGFGTSAPEMLVSSIAAWHGNTGLAVGNALGSNIANIGLIMGVSALLVPVTVHSRALRREIPLLLTTCLLAYGLSLDLRLDYVDGSVLLAGLIMFLLWLVWQGRQTSADDPLAEEVESELPPITSLPKSWFWIFFGLAGLLLGSRTVVWAAVELAHHFGVSDLIIGLTIVALGTSLPELAASLASILRKEDDLAIGNIVGSNMFNILAVYSIPTLVHPHWLEKEVVERDFPWMLGFTVALFLLGLGWRNPGRIGRLGGLLLLAGFCAYQYSLYFPLDLNTILQLLNQKS
ncbi:calcium/sodium antiporter [Methylohalobius crimeensis]|uniref:calcium/sodium antiporter n=1 Tax=Methylohalobius crimeensis TaxID=244365 RepID=UPI0003B439A6|nr:calcium/sodium antiporter [Methylohalobius crimeensis]